MKNNRIKYIDFCKFITMFIVCYDHILQFMSTDYAFNSPFFIFSLSFHMPLFMILSGYFLDINKIRNIECKTYLKNKIIHLVIPAIVWYLLSCLILFRIPNIKDGIEFYWFLYCLFGNYILIYYFAKIIKRNWILCIILCIITFWFPMGHVVKINFLLPFIFVGHYLYKHKNNILKWYVNILLIIVFCILYKYWDFSDTVYVSPIKFYDSTNLIYTVKTALYRFLIGLTICVPIVYICYYIENRLNNILFVFFSSLGKYTLSIYTIHMIIISFFKSYFNKDVILNNIPIPLWLTSLVLCVLVILSCIIITIILKKNKHLSIIFLGENK